MVYLDEGSCDSSGARLAISYFYFSLYGMHVLWARLGDVSSLLYQLFHFWGGRWWWCSFITPYR